MKNSLCLLFMFFLLTTATAAQPNCSSITGKWMSTEDNLMVEVYQVNNEYRARVIWFDDTDDKSRPYTSRLDSKNPDKSLQCKKILGMEVMHGLIYDATDEEWNGGRIYDPSSGKDWNAKAWLDKDGNLKVRGFWHFEWLGQNISFKKVQ